ncbi:hypothetical protein PPERSA_11881 [Pseudocohnilembus persalinus]|uniref:DNA repair metallo-beta-lactamase domain-containing protein n=1 Tax=Pseudocohnilembus persalinus TaxID=266149 RepID=A0A0V0QJR3_PSEPJ|nr:hypothetical protein PPERSA_11881 [Pseudocohnilembus persalinus]|eukprot:KRX02541.1 hypothetical protein PPERSA_11881 [Pseudocohnilembus persalinus]
MTGWVNTQVIQFKDNYRYIIPYANHSNFQEIREFMEIVNPSLLEKNVPENSIPVEEISNQLNLFSISSLKSCQNSEFSSTLEKEGIMIIKENLHSDILFKNITKKKLPIKNMDKQIFNKIFIYLKESKKF